MIDLIHFQKDRFHHIVTNELKPRVPKQVHQVLLSSGEEIIDHDDVIPSRNELINQVATDETGSTGNHDPQTTVPDPDGDSAEFEAGDDVVFAAECGDGGSGSGMEEGSGLRCSDASEGWLDDEECGTDQDSDEDEEEALFSQEVVDGSGEGSVLFMGFWRIRWWRRAHLFVASVT